MLCPIFITEEDLHPVGIARNVKNDHRRMKQKDTYYKKFFYRVRNLDAHCTQQNSLKMMHQHDEF